MYFAGFSDKGKWPKNGGISLKLPELKIGTKIARVPIMQGGMAIRLSTGALAAAVANQGGIGLIAASGMTPQELRYEIRMARSLSKGIIGINIMFAAKKFAEMVNTAIDEGIDLVVAGAGFSRDIFALGKASGTPVVPIVSSVKLAKISQRLGAAAIVVEGKEAGGHLGTDQSIKEIIPDIVAAVDIPVIAAGGIADGRGVAAAFMLGAEGVQMGTRFLSANECTIHPVYKEKILKATDLCTMVTGKRLGHPVRSLRTQFAREYSKAEYGGMPDEELEALATGALRLAVQEGDNEKGCFLSGQIAAMVKKEQPAAEIVKEVMEEAEPILLRASQWVR